MGRFAGYGAANTTSLEALLVSFFGQFAASNLHWSRERSSRCGPNLKSCPVLQYQVCRNSKFASPDVAQMLTYCAFFTNPVKLCLAKKLRDGEFVRALAG